MRFLRKLIPLILLGALLFGFYPMITTSIERFFYPLEYAANIKQAAAEYRLDPYLIAAVIYEESKYDPTVRSNAGAIGLMQIMPQTGAWIAERKRAAFTINDLLKPHVNIDFGSWYLRFLTDKYKGNENLILAAYNGGLQNVDKWRNENPTSPSITEKIPFKETREFVSRVKNSREKYRRLYGDELR